MHPARSGLSLPVGLALTALPLALGAAMFAATSPTTGSTRGVSTLPAVQHPVGNPPTEAKRVLGKALFFEEQLSTDNTVSCASCHQHDFGGADPRVALTPGFDGVLGNGDDIRGSPGVIAQNADRDYEPSPVFGVTPQITGRAANPVINAAFFPELFWDGRAGGAFTDPLTGEVLLTEHAALESQAVGPPVDSIEMAHADRDWSQVSAKLAHARPLALATNLPADLSSEVLDARTYPELFRRAFGDPAITPARIAMALGVYQRTLISDDTPWDRFIAGDPDALTPAQARGWQVFQSNAGRCDQCHTPPLFTDNSYRNIGVRPIIEDTGRQQVTGDPADAGRFKVPGLRNSGLKRTYFHTGRQPTVDLVLTFYSGNGQDQENIDPLVPGISLNPGQRADLADFVRNGLLDTRVRDGQFPFDAPDLFFRQGAPLNPVLLPGAGRPDSTGLTPNIIARTPPLIGTDDFRIGVSNVAPGAIATLVMSATAPANGRISPDTIIATVEATDAAPGEPCATAHWPIPPQAALDGEVRYLQWRVEDPALAEPALSRVVRVTFLCGFGDCQTGCAADIDRNGRIDFFDITGFLARYNAQDPSVDFEPPLGTLNFFDLTGFISLYNAGCP